MSIELEPDRDQLEIFIEALFRHALVRPEGFVSLRSFCDWGEPQSRNWPRIMPVRLPQDSGKAYRFLVDAAVDEARRAAQAPEKAVFAPPVAIFADDKQATEKALLAGVALSLELDANPSEALATVEDLIGPATIVVRSGGLWMNPQTGEPEDKLHAHWRLSELARGEAKAKLKRARALMTALAGGDPTNVPIVHPIRWPGSWHRKGEPRLATILRVLPDKEIDLSKALEALKAALPEEQRSAPPDSDYDGDGQDWEPLLSKIISAEEIYPSCPPLTMKLMRAGMQDGAVVNMARAVVNLSQARVTEPERWRNAYDKIPAMVRDGRAKIEAEQKAEEASDEQKEGGPAAPEWQWRYCGRQQDEDDRRYLVNKLLPEIGVGLISGQWGTYKTFAALDLAAAVITSTPFAGFEIARPGAVLFIALEGQDEVNIRFRAALTHRGYMELLAPFAWIDTCPRLLNGGAGATLTAMVEQAAERMRQDFNLPVALVIVDTAGKAAGYAKTGDENDAVVGKQIVTALAEASRKTGALFLGLDHFGKAAETGTRGSSAKESDCDVVLALLGEKNMAGQVTNPRLAIRKRRGGTTGEEIRFQTRIVQAGDDETTLVINWAVEAQEEAVYERKTKDTWTKSLRVLRSAMMSTLAEHGKDCRPIEGGPGVRTIDVEIVRAEFYKSYLADGDAKAKQAARQKAFRRAVKEAQDKSLIGVRDVGTITVVWFWTEPPKPPADGSKYSAVELPKAAGAALPPGAIGNAPPGVRCILCGKGRDVFRFRGKDGGVDYMHAACTAELAENGARGV